MVFVWIFRVILVFLVSFRNSNNQSVRWMFSSHRVKQKQAFIGYKNRKKPQWVVDEVIRVKAYRPDLSCRTISEIFNLKYSQHKVLTETVSKSYVAYIIKQHRYQLMQLRREIKSKPAYNIPFNKVWGVDLSFVDGCPLFGAVEHHSRKCLSLRQLKDKRSITILRAILDILDCYPKPQFIRTDNEVCFNSKLITFGLWFLGIKKQTIDKHSPWQNGRIERFFGTLKSTINNLPTHAVSQTELPYCQKVSD